MRHRRRRHAGRPAEVLARGAAEQPLAIAVRKEIHCLANEVHLLGVGREIAPHNLSVVAAPHEALRTEGLYHLTHHRGQLTVYLRLLDIPIPPIYGPTADEGRL